MVGYIVAIVAGLVLAVGSAFAVVQSQSSSTTSIDQPLVEYGSR